MTVLEPTPAHATRTPSMVKKCNDPEGGETVPSPAASAPHLGVNWVWALGMVGTHLLALLAPMSVTGPGLFAAGVLYLVCGVAVSMGNHRLFAHSSFVAVRPLRWALAILGTLAGQGGPIRWCAVHRLHHRHSDGPDDPQQSGAPFWDAHILWALTTRPPGGRPWTEHPIVADLRQDRLLRFLESHHASLNALFAALLVAAGWAAGGRATAISVAVWGVGVRVVVGWHATFVINSVAHRWGYRNYPTRDNSRNVWWLAPVSFGECWHNNHHARPQSAAHGHRWFEFDPIYRLIRVLGWFGLASRISRARHSPGEPKPKIPCCHGPGTPPGAKSPLFEDG